MGDLGAWELILGSVGANHTSKRERGRNQEILPLLYSAIIRRNNKPHSVSIPNVVCNLILFEN